MLSLKTHQEGLGMVEVLVSLLLLGVGLLGALSLQATSLNTGQRANFTLEAQFAATDMAARLLAYGNTQPNAADIDDYDGTDTEGTYDDPNCNPCDRLETIALDRFEWKQLLEGNDITLPSAQGEVDWDAADNMYTITVRYDRDRTGATGTNCDSNDKSTTGNLTCFIMEVRL